MKLPTGAHRISIDWASSGDSSTPLIHANAEEAQAVSSVRIGDVAVDITVVPEKMVRAAGVVGLAIAPIFIILDFEKGNPVGGAFGAVGMVLGTLAITAVEGPIGWLVGGLAALFVILPTLFNKHSADIPSARDATEILQYAMFGDRHHTGNEKCREQNPNCTLLYGPGIIGASLGWDHFDSIVFLLHYNHGYAMSLHSMAAAFYIVDPLKPGDGADQIATINCHSHRADCTRLRCSNPDVHQTHCGRFRCPYAQRAVCGKPTFTLNRPLVTIPVLNQTADKIYERIIPKPHGDCKLVNDMAENRYEDYKISVTGSPAAIACVITASIVSPPVQNMANSSAKSIGDSNAQNITSPSLQNSSSSNLLKLGNTEAQKYQPPRL